MYVAAAYKRNTYLARSIARRAMLRYNVAAKPEREEAATMPLKGGRMTSRERALIEARASGADMATAARRAGYATKAAAYEAAAKPEILAAIQAQQAARLVHEGLPIAVQTLIEIASDARQPPASRIQASKIIVDRGLPLGDPARDKRPEDMSGEELARAIAALQRRASDLARPVDAIVVDAAPEPAASVLD
jgi:hypothetical protein